MKWLHHLLRGVSLTAALFVFQACYGTPTAQMPLEDPDAVEAGADAEEAAAEDATAELPAAE